MFINLYAGVIACMSLCFLGVGFNDKGGSGFAMVDPGQIRFSLDYH